MMTFLNIKQIILTLTLLCGAVVGVSAADRLYIETSGVEPGETRTLYLQLENSQDYYGFQADIQLPAGLEFLTLSGEPQVALTERTDESFRLVTNLVSPGYLKIGTFSTTHTPFSGESGELLAITVKADTGFTGGDLKISDIYFTDASNNDVELPDFKLSLGVDATNTFYIEDFTTEVNGITRLQIILDNETPFRAFQTDIYMPEGLEIVDNSFALTSRGASGHTLSSKTFNDGRTRLACISLSDQVFSGHSGALVEFSVRAVKGVADECEIELKNQIFSRTDASEYMLPNSVAHVIVERSGVTGLELPLTAEMKETETMTLTPVVTPEEAIGTALKWESSQPSVATVDQKGEVTAISIGKTVIKVSSPTNSSVYAECELTVIAMPVSEITLDTYSITLQVGGKQTLRATISPDSAHDKSVSWSSNNPSIADVDSDGNVTAYSLGEAEITVTANDGSGVTSKCTVNVVPTPATGITIIDPDRKEFRVGETIVLKAEVTPAEATDRSVVWTSKTPETASVDSDGTVTALKEGEVRITARGSAGHEAEIELTVVPTAVETIELEPGDLTLTVGETRAIEATVSPATATDKSLRWSTSSKEIADVDDEGNVTAYSLGEAEITVAANDGSGVQAKCTVKVVPTPATGITIIDPDRKEFRVGETIVLKAEVTPADATDKSVVWTSKTTETASVESDGTVTALKEGEVRITARDSAGHEVEIELTVVPTAVETIELKPVDLTLTVGETRAIEATVSPATATDKSLRWSTSSKEIADVDDEGNVTAYSLGEAEITVAANDGSGVTSKCTVKVVPTPATGITIIDPDRKEFRVGETIALKAEVTPANATDKSVEWTSKTPETASVESDGTVTALKEGEVRITARDSAGHEAEIELTVVPTPVETIELKPVDLTLTVGETRAIEATVSPATATDKSLRWSTSSKEIADVDSQGKVYALTEGNAIITAEALDGSGKTAHCNVTVVLEPLPVNVLSLPEISMQAGVVKTVYMELENETDFTAFQMDIYTPEGVRILDGSVKMTDRGRSSHSISTSYFEKERRTRVFCISLKNENFNGNSGPLFGLDLSAESPLEDGLIQMRNIRFTTSNSEEYALEDKETTINVERVLVSKISLNHDSYNLRLGESEQLIASIQPENATDKTVLWESSDSKVVSIDSDGNMKGLAIGEAIIYATAKDGGGVKAECKVSVVPILVERIEVEAEELRVKKGRTLQLSATVFPEDATDKRIVWSTSDPGTAEVSPTGLVTAYKSGEVDITVAATDESGITRTVTVTVTPPLKGDVNNNDIVNVTDVVGIINYILGKEDPNFDIEAADVNGDGKIAISDATAVVKIILSQELNPATISMMRRSSNGNESSSRLKGCLSSNDNSSIDIVLSNQDGIVALQADIALPAGFEILNVDMASEDSGHGVLYNITEDNIVRAVVFSLNNQPLPSGDSRLLTIGFRGDSGYEGGDMAITTIIAADKEASETILDPFVGHIALDTTGVGAFAQESPRLIVTANGIIIDSSLDEEITICSLEGKVIKHFVSHSRNETLELVPGVYIVKIGECSNKVLIK